MAQSPDTPPRGPDAQPYVLDEVHLEDDAFGRQTESGWNLWRLIAAPTIWAVHFLFVYLTGAIHCASAGRGATLQPVHTITLWASGVALVLIGLLALSTRGIRGRSVTGDDLDFEANTPEERSRFLAHATLMLCVLSAAAVLFVTIPVLIVRGCA